MNTKDYFKDIYKDFFDSESLPKIIVKEEETGSQDKMTSLFLRIDNLNITKESKELLNKIINYMNNYKEGKEKNYIPFRVIINANNNEVIKEINDILYEAGSFNNYFVNNKELNISLHKINKELDLNDVGFISLFGLNGLNLVDDKDSRDFIYNFKEFLKKDDKVLITISGTKEELNAFFLGKEDIKNNYFIFNIEGINPDVQDIYNEVLENVNLEDNQKIELLDYMTLTYSEDIDYISYKNDLIKYISFNKSIPIIKKDKSIEEVFSELNELVGLTKVKKVLYELVDLIKLKEKAGESLKINNLNLHMVFLGNPGTGKTTIARLISNILYNLKYIKENKLVEVSVKDLVAEYVGQTAPKTNAVIEKAMNGVLFIDEAYALASTNDSSYNDEAIATLIQAMENYRDKLVVIFAGYTKEMQAFLNSNSGITSRIGYTLEFEDYTTKELIEIFKGMVKKSGFIIEEDAIKYLEEIINKYRNMKNFGNARFVRNIFEKTVIKHASNVKNKKQKSILKTITKKDINIENLILN